MLLRPVTRTIPQPPSHANGQPGFLRHLRRRFYPPFGRYLHSSWLLGYFSVFFLVLECVTGAALMVYYVPTPEKAYLSIISLMTEVNFGWLIRDLHRLGGELMLIVTTLHMARVFGKGAYRETRRLTWLSGVLLWLMTLLLAFSGYLLPWDQLAYWAVTIGTSLVEPIPLIGNELALLLRGGPTFGADGLLRFYLLHILLIPALYLLLLASHFYRVSRLHGVLLVADKTPKRPAQKDSPRERLPFLPVLVLVEACLALATLFLLIVACTWMYDAPLQYHADPLHTPPLTRAPWFFLWLQGLLKLGNGLVMGVVLPGLALTGLLFFPYVLGPREGSWGKTARFRIIIALSIAVGLLTILGLGQTANDASSPAAILQELAPEQTDGPIDRITYDDLVPGIHLSGAVGDDLPPSLAALLDEFNVAVTALTEARQQQGRGIIVIEEWQANLKRITLRIHLEETTSGHTTPHTFEKRMYRHRHQQIASS